MDTYLDETVVEIGGVAFALFAWPDQPCEGIAVYTGYTQEEYEAGGNGAMASSEVATVVEDADGWRWARGGLIRHDATGIDIDAPWHGGEVLMLGDVVSAGWE